MQKRCFDILVSLFALVVLSPLLLAIAFAVLVMDGRPVLFCHQRMGRHRRSFQLYKFRTMRNTPDSGPGHFEPGDRSRITRLGKLLRRSKLDELPQLWNVLRGEMSLVGPRPEVEKWTVVFPERWDRVLQARPGLTDPASILYRNEEELLSQQAEPSWYYEQEILPRKLALYENYVRQQTLVGDLVILLQTCSALAWPRQKASPV